MNRLAVITLLLIIGCFPASAQSNWKTLFDGHSTDQWRGYKRDAFPEKGWTVENGALKTIVHGDAVDLITKDTYRNFELELEWKISPGGNSGIIYLFSEDAPESWQTGPEMQILDDDKHPDAKAGRNANRTAGALYDLIPPAGKTLRPVGQFNRARIIVNNGHVEHWLNGKKIVAYDLDSDEFKRLVAESKFKEYAGFAKNKQGHIALQYHGNEVWFRNIRIRTLPGK